MVCRNRPRRGGVARLNRHRRPLPFQQHRLFPDEPVAGDAQRRRALHLRRSAVRLGEPPARPAAGRGAQPFRPRRPLHHRLLRLPDGRMADPPPARRLGRGRVFRAVFHHGRGGGLRNHRMAVCRDRRRQRGHRVPRLAGRRVGRAERTCSPTRLARSPRSRCFWFCGRTSGQGRGRRPSENKQKGF